MRRCLQQSGHGTATADAMQHIDLIPRCFSQCTVQLSSLSECRYHYKQINGSADIPFVIIRSAPAVLQAVLDMFLCKVPMTGKFVKLGCS